MPILLGTLRLYRLTFRQAYRHYNIGTSLRQQSQKRIATLASTQSRKPYQRTPKIIKEAQAKGKKLARDMSAFWKKNDKEERELRRKEQKEALERLRAEEEKREASRQARKLEFLISQTELYSHFVGNKLKSEWSFAMLARSVDSLWTSSCRVRRRGWTIRTAEGRRARGRSRETFSRN